MYLQTNPTEDFLKQEQNKLMNRISLIEKGAPIVNGENDIVINIKKKKRAEYFKTMNISDSKNQLSTILFLLN